MAYPSSQNAGYPGFRPQVPPMRDQSVRPPNIGPQANMIASMPPKPGPGMNPPGSFAPTNGQLGQTPYLQGPSMSQPATVPPNQNGLSQQPYNSNHPGYQFPAQQAHATAPPPPSSIQAFPGPRMGSRPPAAGPSQPLIPNGPTAVTRTPGVGPSGPPPRGPVPAVPQYGGPPRGPAAGPPVRQQYRPQGPGGIPQVSVAQPGSHPQPTPPPPGNVGMGDSRPSSSTPSSLQDSTGGRAGELPVPYHGQAQYSHQIGEANRLTAPITPSNSEPTSRKSSRAPSPVTSPTIDALEGQFTPSSQGPPSGHGTPPPLSSAPVSGSPGPGIPQPDPSQRPGIVGRRVYPQSGGAQQFQGAPGPQQYGGPQGQPGQPQFGGQPRPGVPGQFGGPAGPQNQSYGGPPGQFSAISPGLPGTQLTGPPGPPGQSFGGPPGPPGQSFGGPPGPPGQSFGSPPGPPGQPFGGPPRPPGQSFGGPPGQPLGGPPGPPGQPLGGPPGPPGPPGSQPTNAMGPQSQQFGGTPGQQFTGNAQSTSPPSGPAGYQGSLPQTRYPPNVGQSQQPGFSTPTSNSYPGAMTAGFGQMSLQDNSRAVNLLQERKLIPPTGVETPKANLQNDFKKVNCNPEIFRCTLTSIPQTSSLLNKARLPLGILIHPFKDLSQLPVIQSSVIVRCRSCRTYINPFVYFVDTRRWKCNLCYRINDLPDEFSYDPISKTYGDPQRRPEVRSSTIEFIAPSEYMLRPPQPAVYLFVLDVSFNAVETGYLNVFCETLLEELDKLPGDARTHVGFIAFDRAVHFFNLAEGLSQPQLLTVSDIDDIFLPSPDNLLVNIHESRELVVDLLNQLPTLFADNEEVGNSLGAALQAAYKMMSATGGRVTVVQTCLPSAGPGALNPREDPNLRKSKEVQNLGPATDFYKKLALDCSAQQIAVDLFLLNGQFTDVGTLACISKFSSGCIYSYPSFHATRNPLQRDSLECDLRRYFTRKIGFEAVMRIRCTKGLSIHTFHGNFFVRSTDLLSLPNINPDAGFGMQMSIEDSLTDSPTVCFQAALLYTSSKGERRIRVHTMCLPVTNQISEVYSGADQQCIVGLLAKMAADRTVTVSLNEAREAMINAALDSIASYGATLTASQRAGNLMSANSLRLIPLYVLALLKSLAFRVGPVTKLDDRVIALERCKTLPLNRLVQIIHPDLYPVHALTDENGLVLKEAVIAQPPILQLSSANLDRHGAFLLDTGDHLYLLVGSSVSDQFCQDVFDRPNFMSLEDGLHELPELENQTSERLRNFINYLMDQRPQGVNFTVLRDDSKDRGLFFQHMVEDRTESTMSYYEFLQYLQKQLKG